jgi:hydrogenase nickel incorporation protein HypB
MCATCGCSEPDIARDHSHVHEHGHEHGHGTTIRLEQSVLAKNDAFAAENRVWFREHGVLALNIVSSPGAGKTTLLARTIRDLAGRLPISVIEGDQETSRDADRIRATGAAVVQINTGAACHLDAHSVGHALEQLRLSKHSCLVIENVGNLICPGLFDLGEERRILLASVTEGEDKPLKYPYMFRSADVILLNKIDLLPHVDFNPRLFEGYLREVNPGARVIHVSATRGEGLDSWYSWLLGLAGARKEPSHV